MYQRFDWLDVINVYDLDKSASHPVPHRGAKKTSPAAGLWASAAPVPEVHFSSEARAAIFAHEVINSLTAIDCSLQFVKAELDAHRIDDPILTKVVRGALTEIQGVGSLVHEYCAMAEAEPPPWKLTDVGTLVDNVLALQTIRCRAAGISVHFEREDAPAVDVVGRPENKASHHQSLQERL